MVGVGYIDIDMSEIILTSLKSCTITNGTGNGTGVCLSLKPMWTFLPNILEPIDAIPGPCPILVQCVYGMIDWSHFNTKTLQSSENIF